MFVGFLLVHSMLLTPGVLPTQVNLVGPGSFEGPRRYIEWCRPTDLFYQYQVFAESRGEPIASFSTFRRIMKRIFATHLRCRDKGENGQCDVCYKLKGKIKRAATKNCDLRP